jgi:UDP-glucose 4-epimerase
MDMNILITGGPGHLDSHTCVELLQAVRFSCKRAEKQSI